MKTPSQKSLLIAIVALQLLLLSGIIGFHSAQLKGARRILLETEPVDPFSAFRGRYIALNYKISNLPTSLVKDASAKNLKHNDPVYVVVEQKEKVWEPVGVYRHKPTGANVVYLMGRISSIFEFRTVGNSIRIKYGIESFFLSEDSADAIEQQRGNRGGAGNWQQMQKERQQRLEQLSDEDKRINRNNVSEWWLKILEKEMEAWVKEARIDQATATKLGDKYKTALERISIAKEGPGTRRPNLEQNPLVVEVAVSKEGRAYPCRLFWEGKEYR
ncbi:MAG: GDYXXLXY domain-containing protein [Candidatus Omnitrophota bacterium]